MLIFLAIAVLGGAFLAVRRFAPAAPSPARPVEALVERSTESSPQPWDYSPVKIDGQRADCVECCIAVDGSTAALREWSQRHGADRHGLMRADDAMAW